VRVCITGPRATAPSRIAGLSQRDGTRFCNLEILGVRVGIIDEDDCQMISP
jgi:hypothetical protein